MKRGGTAAVRSEGSGSPINIGDLLHISSSSKSESFDGSSLLSAETRIAMRDLIAALLSTSESTWVGAVSPDVRGDALDQISCRLWTTMQFCDRIAMEAQAHTLFCVI